MQYTYTLDYPMFLRASFEHAMFSSYLVSILLSWFHLCLCSQSYINQHKWNIDNSPVIYHWRKSQNSLGRKEASLVQPLEWMLKSLVLLRCSQQLRVYDCDRQVLMPYLGGNLPCHSFFFFHSFQTVFLSSSKIDREQPCLPTRTW